MAWKKIDDDQAQADMPYSAFLANGLTTNANSYNNDMTRGGGIAWNATDPVTWSSFWNPQGVMFTVNVGQAVLQIDFRITYATLTASVDADGFQGIVFLQNMTSGELVRVGLLPTNGAVSYLDISLPLNAATTGRSRITVFVVLCMRWVLAKSKLGMALEPVHAQCWWTN